MQLDSNQWNLVYNVFSFGLVSMLACTIYTLVSQQRVLAKYRNALVMSSMVTFIAGYHYLRIFDSSLDGYGGESSLPFQKIAIRSDVRAEFELSRGDKGK